MVHVPGVMNRQLVVMGAPEKRDVVEPVAVAEHVARDDLALALRYDPVLHSESGIRIRVGPARDVARREYIAGTGLEEFVDGDPVVEANPCALGKAEVGTDSNTRDHQIGIESRSVIKDYRLGVDCLHGVTEVELHTTLFMDAPDQHPQLGAEHTFEREILWGDDVNLEAARHQGRGDLEPDEAGADHHRRSSRAQAADDGAAVSKRPQIS